MNRYKTLDSKFTKNGKRYKLNPIYPSIPLSGQDIYIVGGIGDRYDTLAQQFYNDSSLWWVIASANNLNKSSLAVTPGIQLRIPQNIDIILRDFEDINKNR